MNEIKITQKIIEYFNNKNFDLTLKAGKRNQNVLAYEYDIEILKNEETIGIIEAKLVNTSHSSPTTDAMLASIFKISYEFVLNFNQKPKIIFLFYTFNGTVGYNCRNNIFNKFKSFIDYFDSNRKSRLNYNLINLNIDNIEQNISNIVDKLYEELIEIC